jgi:hypothetical protein
MKAVSNPFVVLDIVMSTCPANELVGLTTVTVKHATDGCVCGGWLGVGKVTSTGRHQVEHPNCESVANRVFQSCGVDRQPKMR